MSQRRMPPSKRIRPLSRPPLPQIPEQPELSPEEIEALKAKKRRKKREDKKVNMPKVWEYKKLQG